MFLRRERGDEEDENRAASTKQRNGPLGQADLIFQGAYTRFESRNYSRA
jgi:replicative DNA helicase